MNNISLPLVIDIVIAAVILVFAIVGIAKGFVKTVFDFFHGIAAGAVAYLLTPTITGLIKKTSFYTGLVEKTKDAFYETVKSFLESDPEKLVSGEFSAFFERFGISRDFIFSEYERLVSEKLPEAALSITENVVSPALSVLLTVVSFLLLFVLAIIVLRLVLKLFNGISNLPVIKGFNKLLGGIAGGILGCIAVFLIITAFEAILPFAAGTTATITVKEIAEGSYLYGIFTAINPLTLLFALIA